MSSAATTGQSRLLITQSTFTFQQRHDNSAFLLLHTFICAQAFLNVDLFDDLKCLPGTRAAILKALEDWAAILSEIIQPIIWLHGPAGSGKTAIARSMVDRYKSTSKLAASFFFWRTDSERSDEKKFIPTLAYQLSLSIPSLKPYIEYQVHQDPTILQQSPLSQLTSLILEPLSKMRQDHPSLDPLTLPRLIIIDGLDECGTLRGPENQVESQRRTLDVLQQLVGHQAIFPFKLLILSRTEYHLRQVFDTQSLKDMTHRIHLDYSFSPEQDILVYVTHDFLWITSNHPHRDTLPPGWPGISIIHRIVKRSSGQFIYAATIMRFLRAPRFLPDRQLQHIKRHLSSQEVHELSTTVTLNTTLTYHNSPFTPLDDLYHQIVSSAVDPLTAITALSFYLVHEMAFLYSGSRGLRIENIESTLSLFPGSIHHSLCDFESLLNPAGYFNLEFYHTSFIDFLYDKSRSRDWHIDLRAESERFCLIDLAAFRRAQTVNDQTSWFHCFCEALTNSHSLSSDIQNALDASWNDVVSYHAGLCFLKKMGKRAGSCYVDLLHAYQGKGHPDTDRLKLCQSLNHSMTKLFHPFLLIYKSNAHLYALFLLSLFDPTFDSQSDSNENAPDWVCHKSKQALVRIIRHSPRLSSLDNRALKITGPRNQPGISWIRSLLLSFYTKRSNSRGLNHAPDPTLDDDQALRNATKVLLDLVLNVNREIPIGPMPRAYYDGAELVIRKILNSLSPASVGLILNDLDSSYPYFVLHWLCNK